MNNRTKLMLNEIKTGLGYSAVVMIDLQAFAEKHDVTKRSAFRDLRDIKSYTDLHIRMKKGKHYFSVDSMDLNAILSGDGRFVPLPEFTEALNGSANADEGSFGNYISIYLERGDMQPGMDFFESEEQIERIEPSGTFGELSSMVASVCGLDPMLLLEDDEYKIEKLFKTGATADQVYRRYSRNTKPNFWYSNYWKGRDKHAWPTIVDVLQTWKHAQSYVPKKSDSWPPFKDIYATMCVIMSRRGHRQTGETMEELAEFGYDEIVNQVEGGCYYLTTLPEKQMRIEIATAVREIKTIDRR